MRERPKILRKTVVPDGAGGEVEDWSEIAEVWARVLPKSADEKVEAGQVASVEVYEVTVRVGVDIGTHDRLQWKGKVCTIQAAPEPPSGDLYRTLTVTYSPNGVE